MQKQQQQKTASFDCFYCQNNPERATALAESEQESCSRSKAAPSSARGLSDRMKWLKNCKFKNNDG